MVAIAAKGYQATTVDDIVKAAGISNQTFYEHFSSKQEILDATLYSGRTRMMGVLLPIVRRARNWPEGIRATTMATLDFLAAEPEFAQLITVDVYAAGADALERRDLGLEGTASTLEGGLQYNPEVSPVQREGIMSVLYSLVSNRVRRDGAGNLREMAPLATYIALSPFIGPDAALEIANGGAWVDES